MIGCMKRPLFVGENIYHIFNRGVDKRDVFLDDVDRYQFIHDMFEFNDKALASDSYYKIRH